MENLEAGRWSRIKRLISSLKVEPYMFLLMFSYSIKAVTVQELYQDKTCLFELKMSKHFCLGLQNKLYKSSSIKMKILKLSSDYSLYQTLIHFTPSAILSLYSGIWCTRYTHAYKTLLMISAIGFCIETAVLIYYAIYFDSTHPLMTLTAFFSGGLCGGMLTAVSVVYSFVSQDCDEDMRVVRFALLEFSYYIGK